MDTNPRHRKTAAGNETLEISDPIPSGTTSRNRDEASTERPAQDQLVHQSPGNACPVTLEPPSPQPDVCKSTLPIACGLAADMTSQGNLRTEHTQRTWAARTQDDESCSDTESSPDLLPKDNASEDDEGTSQTDGNSSIPLKTEAACEEVDVDLSRIDVDEQRVLMAQIEENASLEAFQKMRLQELFPDEEERMVREARARDMVERTERVAEENEDFMAALKEEVDEWEEDEEDEDEEEQVVEVDGNVDVVVIDV